VTDTIEYVLGVGLCSYLTCESVVRRLRISAGLGRVCPNTVMMRSKVPKCAGNAKCAEDRAEARAELRSEMRRILCKK
jgi:hypothetical protein